MRSIGSRNLSEQMENPEIADSGGPDLIGHWKGRPQERYAVSAFLHGILI